MSYFARPTQLNLETEAELVSVLTNGTFPTKVDKYCVRSQYIVDIVRELKAQRDQRTVYNTELTELVRTRLNLKHLPAKNVGDEGSMLSLLVYNAQKYYTTEALHAMGYSEFTQEMVDEAFVTKRKIDYRDSINGSVALTVRKCFGECRAFRPRKRQYYIAPLGQPAKLV